MVNWEIKKFTVIGVDKFSYEDWFHGAYGTPEEAIAVAEFETAEGRKYASDDSIATVYYAYDEKDRQINRHGYPNLDNNLMAAVLLAAQKHNGQYRKDGVTPYIKHPEAVAGYLQGIGITDANILAAAWLHDVVEDTDCTITDLEEKMFDKKIIDYVRRLTRVKGKESREDYIRKIDESSLEVKLIKLADLAHNSETLGDLAPEKRNRMLKDIRYHYLPLAEKICPELHDVIIKNTEKNLKDILRGGNKVS